jgi:hypothetical protein
MRFTKVERKKMTIAYRSFVLAKTGQQSAHRILRAGMIRDFPDAFCNGILALPEFSDYYRGRLAVLTKCKKVSGVKRDSHGNPSSSIRRTRSVGRA